MDALLAQGVTPWATLYHWDLPQGLQDKGGWASRDTALRQGDYAAIVATRLGDRVKNFIVLNEEAVHAVLGHVIGEHAPGLKDGAVLGPVIHHQNLAQGLAIQALRANAAGARVGTTMALQPIRPDGGSPINNIASDGFDALWNRGFLDPLLLGSYPKSVRDAIGAALKSESLAIMRQPIDFLGVNYYSPTYIKLDLASPSRIGPGAPPVGAPRDAFDREVDPSVLYDTLQRVKTDYGDPLIYITENGCSDPVGDGPAVLDDGFRIAYLRDHLGAVKSAMEAGGRVGGYFHWSLIDNWEWSMGYTSKFGLVAMGRASGVRTPKKSCDWMKALAQSGLLDQSA